MIPKALHNSASSPRRWPKVDPDLVVRDGKGQIFTVRYEAVNAMLLNEFLKQHHMVEDQTAEIQDLKTRLEKLEQLVAEQNGGAQ